MHDDHAPEWLKTLLAAIGRLEQFSAQMRDQAQETQAAIKATREQEEIRFKQAMAALFADQQQRVETALRPQIARAWQVLAALVGVGALIFIGWLLLMNQAHTRLQAAQARADAIEVSAEVQAASRHVEITSCGGRPCIRLDKTTPIWKSRSGEYVLVDGKPEGRGR